MSYPASWFLCGPPCRLIRSSSRLSAFFHVSHVSLTTNTGSQARLSHPSLTLSIGVHSPSPPSPTSLPWPSPGFAVVVPKACTSSPLESLILIGLGQMKCRPSICLHVLVGPS